MGVMSVCVGKKVQERAAFRGGKAGSPGLPEPGARVYSCIPQRPSTLVPLLEEYPSQQNPPRSLKHLLI